ncbi:MAG: LCP family protein, partial [Streptosporangiaceae bacterium]
MGDDTNLDDLLDGDEEQPPRRRRWPLALGSLGALVLLAVVAVGGLLYGLQRTYDANIRRVPHAFAPVPSASPRP